MYLHSDQEDCRYQQIGTSFHHELESSRIFREYLITRYSSLRYHSFLYLRPSLTFQG